MYFRHSQEIWRDYPQLVPGVIFARGISQDVSVVAKLAKFNAIAASRLAARPEGGQPEIQAWRRVFSSMGLKPTQYRCAAESLMRRFKRELSLPALHPLVDLCNSMSLAFAVPIAVFDASKIVDYLEVRYASGDETFWTLSGESETPSAGEVVFVDAARRAHARRWTHRQSGYSAVRGDTSMALIVAEAVHESADVDVRTLIDELAAEIRAFWPGAPETARLTSSSPRFEFPAG